MIAFLSPFIPNPLYIPTNESDGISCFNVPREVNAPKASIKNIKARPEGRA